MRSFTVALTIVLLSFCTPNEIGAQFEKIKEGVQKDIDLLPGETWKPQIEINDSRKTHQPPDELINHLNGRIPQTAPTPVTTGTNVPFQQDTPSVDALTDARKPTAPTPTPHPENATAPGLAKSPSELLSQTYRYTFWLSIAVLGFGVLLLGAILSVFRYTIHRNANQTWDDSASRIVVIITIIFSSLFLITAGFSNDQITPVIGLFGAIVGYLLGKTTERTPQPTTPSAATAPSDSPAPQERGTEPENGS